jgi:hypothetical protein
MMTRWASFGSYLSGWTDQRTMDTDRRTLVALAGLLVVTPLPPSATLVVRRIMSSSRQPNAQHVYKSEI